MVNSGPWTTFILSLGNVLEMLVLYCDFSRLDGVRFLSPPHQWKFLPAVHLGLVADAQNPAQTHELVLQDVVIPNLEI